MKQHPKKIMFLGLGGAGQRHLRVFRKLLPSVEMFAWRAKGKTPFLEANFSVRPDLSLEDHYNIRVFGNIQEALSKSPDLCVIANPTSCHAPTAIEAAKRGIDIFVEKPGCQNLTEFRDLENAIKSNKAFALNTNRGCTSGICNPS